MAIVIIDTSSTILLGSQSRVSVTVQDDTVDPAINTDPYRLYLKMMDINGGLILEDIWPSPASRIVRIGVGQFYVNIGPVKAELNGSTAAGATTLIVDNATPRTSADWPGNGTISIDIGGNREYIPYLSTNITAGSGSIILASPLTINHADNIILYGPNKETTSLGLFLFNWQIEMTQGGVITDSIAQIKVISPKATAFLPDFRQIIDKSRKFIAPKSECFLGYTDSQLLGYLEGGLGTINAYQPSLTFTFENYPLEYKQILLDAGLISGVTSQQLYAIDTDIPNYNDQGTSFVIVHQPQLASFLNQITQRLDRIIPMMKLQLLSPGSLHVKAGADYRLQQLVQASPSGSLFRNIYFKA